MGLTADDIQKATGLTIEPQPGIIAQASVSSVSTDSSASIAEVATSETTTSDTYTALTTAGPSITIPASGDYQVTIGFTGANDTSGANATMSYDIGGTGAVDADFVTAGTDATGSTNSVSRTRIKTGLTTGVVLTCKYRRGNAAGTATFLNRFIFIRRVA